MNKQLTTLILPLLTATGPALAQPAKASEVIVKKARCITCHTVDQKRVAPACKDVASLFSHSPAPGVFSISVYTAGQKLAIQHI